MTNSQSSPKPMSTESVMPSNHLILYHPFLLPSIFPSIKVFSNESALHNRWPEYWSFSFSISLSNVYSRLISFRMDWLDLPAVQGTLKCLLQHHSSKASILQHSAFFMVQLSHPYMISGKTVTLTRRTLCIESNPREASSSWGQPGYFHGVFLSIPPHGDHPSSLYKMLHRHIVGIFLSNL